MSVLISGTVLVSVEVFPVMLSNNCADVPDIGCG